MFVHCSIFVFIPLYLWTVSVGVDGVRIRRLRKYCNEIYVHLICVIDITFVECVIKILHNVKVMDGMFMLCLDCLQCC